MNIKIIELTILKRFPYKEFSDTMIKICLSMLKLCWSKLKIEILINEFPVWFVVYTHSFNLKECTHKYKTKRLSTLFLTTGYPTIL